MNKFIKTVKEWFSNKDFVIGFCIVLALIVVAVLQFAKVF